MVKGCESTTPEVDEDTYFSGPSGVTLTIWRPSSSSPCRMASKACWCFFQESVKSTFNANNGELTWMMKISSDEFLHYIKEHGISAPSITKNPYLNEARLCQSFVEEGIRCSQKAEGYKVRIVFHGTDECNVDAILSGGLNPSLRKGQSYGQGEYFASNPAFSLEMLIFAIITEEFDVKGSHIIVVDKSERQLPIATLSFESYEPRALKRAYSFQKLVQKMKETERILQKEKIIRFIILGEYQGASDIYNKACEQNGNGVPPISWAEEAVAYVRDHFPDDGLVDFLFPNLPPRPATSTDFRMLNMKTCDAAVLKATREYCAARLALEGWHGVLLQRGWR